MINRVAGLTGQADKQQVRERKLRQALSLLDSSDSVHIAHPLPEVTLGWIDNAGLISYVNAPNGFALVYGSAHRVPGADHISVTVDNVQGLAHLVLARQRNNQSLLEGLGGSFIVFTGNKQGLLILSGDPSGGRAPYFAIEDGQLAFASHPLVCARLLSSPTLDRTLEDFLLIYGFLPDGRTVYNDVRQLLSGNLLIHEHLHWQIKDPIVTHDVQPYADIPESEESLYETLYEVLLRCTEEQLVSANEVGVLLGGFDSALIASLLYCLGKRVHTYSFRYNETQYNQPHIDKLTAFLGSKHTWIDITPDIIATGLENYAEHYVQPTNWLNYVIQTVYVCKRMHDDGIHYAYSGDGCDAVFLGYPGTYKRTRAFSRLPRLPSWLVNAVVSGLSWPALDRTIGHPYRVAMNLLRATTRPMPARAFLSFRVLDEVTLSALRQGNNPTQDETIEDLVERLAEPFTELSIQRMGYAAKGLISPNRTKLMATTDAAGVLVHSPYLHKGLRTFVSRIPDRLLREQQHTALGDPGKICLMRMAERKRLLPAEVIHQPKLAAIDSPIDEWFANELRPSLESTLAGLPFQPERRHLNALINITAAERFYKRKIGSTRVISDGISLLATYGALCGALNRIKLD